MINQISPGRQRQSFFSDEAYLAIALDCCGADMLQVVHAAIQAGFFHQAYEGVGWPEMSSYPAYERVPELVCQESD